MVGRPFDEKVDVIGHQAVRKNCKRFLLRGRQRLIDCGLRDRVVEKCWKSLSGADCQEIAVQAQIWEAGDSLRPRHERSTIRKVDACSPGPRTRPAKLFAGSK